MQGPIHTTCLIFILPVLLCSSCYKENEPPQIQSTTADPETIKTGETTHLTCVATDPDNDNLTFLWSSSAGTFPQGANRDSVVWEAPDNAATYTLSVIVNDGHFSALGTINVMVEVNPHLSVAPTALNFGIKETEKTIEIKNDGTGTLLWVLSENLKWLTTDKISDEVTTETNTIAFSVSRDGLEPGIYSGTVSVSSNGGNQDISATMEVLDEPMLSVIPIGLNFGQEENQKILEIKNTGNSTLIWSIAENIPWLTVNPKSGNTTEETDQVTLNVNRDDLEPGNYRDSMLIYSNGGDQPITITLEEQEHSGYFTDERDGYIYLWVKIGTQYWMAENLAYLPEVSPPAYGSMNDPYYYVYGYNGTDASEAKMTHPYTTHGVLYNWTAAIGDATGSTSNPSGVQGICPNGWHLPSDGEWEQLAQTVHNCEGPYNQSGDDWLTVGKHLKASGGWNDNGNGTDDFGFAALPGGYRYYYGSFFHIGDTGYWWSATQYNSHNAWYRYLHYSSPDFRKNNYSKDYGFSVRCVRD